jgi:hypothetical protein
VWLREIAGWVLIGAGLAAFGICYFVFLLNRRVLEAAALTFIGFTIFRGGMHLLKVSMAARAAAEVKAPVTASKPVPATRRVTRPVVEHGRPTATVIPGAEAAKS